MTMAHISDEMIDPELRSTGRIIRRVLPYFTRTSIRWANRATRLLNGVNYTHLHYEQRYLRRPDGTNLRICIYRPKAKFTDKTANANPSSAPVPGILWIHGGGFALESPELEAFYFEKIVDATNAVLVAPPDYRNPPKHRIQQLLRIAIGRCCGSKTMPSNWVRARTN